MYPNDWQFLPLEKVTENHDARRVPVKDADRRRGPYPYYGSTGIVDWVDSYLFDGEYLLIAEDGENLRTRKEPIAYLAKGRFWVNNHAHVLSGNERADTRFLMYAFSKLRIDGYLTGSTMPKLTQENLNRIPIQIPSITEQRAIAHVLGSLDDKIELNRQMNQTLEEIDHSLFKFWFVDFGPVRAKAGGRWKRGENLPGMPADMWDLWPSEFEESEVGEIPKGWNLSKVGAETDTVLGGTPSRTEPRFWNDGSIGWINSGAVNEFRIVVPTERVTKLAIENSAAKLLPPHTTVLAITGATIGQVSVLEIPAATNQSVVAVLPTAELPTEFVYFWMRHRMPELLAAQTGGAQQHINKNDVNDLPILLPSRSIMDCYFAASGPPFARIRANAFESLTLAELRDTLLPKLLSGEIRVPANGGSQ